jgi:hypothetical protein
MKTRTLILFLIFVLAVLIIEGGADLNAQEAKYPDKPSAYQIPPNLVIIPVPAQDKGIAKSRSRFIIYKADGKLRVAGIQSMVLNTEKLMEGQMEMEPDYWGLGGEHAFKIDFANWGNGLFWADITTDHNFPITFKVTDKGYAYLCGKGTIKVRGGKYYELGYDIGEEKWIAGIQSPHQIVREGSCEATGRLGLKAAVPSLIEALKDPAWEVRRNACEALGLLGDAKAIIALEEAMADKEESVSKAAAHALKQIREGEPKGAGGGYMFRTATDGP